MIPNLLHQIWYQGSDKIIEPYKSCYDKTLIFLKNTKWKHVFWDKNKIDKFIKKYYNQYWDLYDGYDILVQKLDIARYLILYHYGGCYMDMDMEMIKDFRELIDGNDTLIVSKMSVGIINNGILFSSKNNIFWLDFLNKINENKNKFNFNKMLHVNFTTGPLHFNNFINTSDYKIKILPHHYLEAQTSKYDSKNKTDAYTINHFGNSWIDPIYNIFIYLYQYRKIVLIIVVIIILFFIMHKIIV